MDDTAKARRCAEVLAALARTANARQALAEIGVDRSWAYRRRSADPDFDRRWRAAVRTGRDALAERRSADAGQAGLAELPTGMMMTGSSGKGTLRLERETPRNFSARKRARFLAGLRATCNVKAAAHHAGVSARGAYNSYHADAVFRAAWDAALVEGRVHLEMALIGAAREMLEGNAVASPRVPERGGEGGDAIEPPAITGMDARAAIQLLRLHNPRDVHGRTRGMRVKPADRESTVREIMAKIAAVKAARAREAGGLS